VTTSGKSKSRHRRCSHGSGPPYSGWWPSSWLDELGKFACRDVAAWTAVLIRTHLAFWLYNRLDKRSRIWLYAALQLSRCASFAVLAPIALPASLALGAHVLARSVPY